MMNDSDVRMSDLSLGEKYTDLLKNINRQIKELNVDSYGMVEDEYFVCPNKVELENVQSHILRTKKQKKDIHQQLHKITSLLVKLNKDIKEHQETNYKTAILKRRHTEITHLKTKRKTEIAIERQNAQKRRMEEAYIPSIPSLSELCQDDMSEIDLS